MRVSLVEARIIQSFAGARVWHLERVKIVSTSAVRSGLRVLEPE
jgi:hypothetical protein